MNKTLRFQSHPAFVMGVFAWLVCACDSPTARCDSPLPPASPTETEASDNASGQSLEAEPVAEPEADVEQSEPSENDEAIREAIEQLGSPEFAARERAATELMGFGLEAVPYLSALAESQDPEIRLRATDLVRQLTEGDFQARVDAFLAGKDIDFAGWEYYQSKLGNSLGTRELFIELTKMHPLLVEALDGTSRERAVALEATLAGVQKGMFVERRPPAPVDAVALLLPAADPQVPVTAPLENILLGVLRYEAGSKIQRDPQLAAPVAALIGDWVERSTLVNRGEVIWFSLNWDIPEVYALAMQTLDETQDTELLSLSMQAIARFGDNQSAKRVAKLLDDSRPASERGFAIGEQGQVLVSDVAMATIAMLHKVPLTQIGFESASEHPKISFSIEDLTFPADKPESRSKVRERVDALISDTESKS